MVKRSKELKDEKQEFTKEMTDDRNIRDFIEVCLQPEDISTPMLRACTAPTIPPNFHQ